MIGAFFCLGCVSSVSAQAPAAEPAATDSKKPAADNPPGKSAPAPKPENVRTPPSGAAPAKAAPKQDPPPPEPGSLFFEIRYSIDGTDIQGNRDRSFLFSGINHATDISFFHARPLEHGLRLEFLTVGRYTDNPRVDPERNSLQKAYVKLSGATFDALLGDSLANYSRLTLNQNVKGLHLRKDFTPRFRGQGIAGVFSDRWGSVFREYSVFRDVTLDCQSGALTGFAPPGCVEFPPGSGIFELSTENPAKPYSRLTGGLRGEWKLDSHGSWIAGNWTHGRDLPQSLPEARIFCEDRTTGFLTIRPSKPGCLPLEAFLPGSARAALEATNNDVVGVDSNFEFRRIGLNARAEFVHSWTAGGTPPAGATFSNFICSAQPPVVGGAVLDARCFSTQVGDFAIRAEASQRIRKLRWRADYARFSPNFFSASARQVRDLEDFYARGDYDLTKNVSVTGSLRRSTDNLNGMRHFTNVVRSPEVRVAVRDLPFYRPLLLQAGYRQRTLEAVGSPLPAEARDRVTRMPFVSAEFPIGDARIGLDYEHRQDVDGVRRALSTDTDRYGFSFRGAWSWNGWDLAPELRLDLERQRKHSPNDPTLSPTDPLLVLPVDFFDAFDTGRSMRAGFFLIAPRYFSFEGFFREFNSVVLLPVRASAALDPAQRFFYMNPGFKRPNWRAALGYKIKNDENKTLTVHYERNNNFFSAGDPLVPDVRSFRETVIGGSVLLRFGR